MSTFTNPWSDTIPPVGTLADLIGVHLRQTRQDLQERLYTLVGLPAIGKGNPNIVTGLESPLDQDPLWLQDSVQILGINGPAPTSRFLEIPAADFNPPDNAASYLRNAARILNNSSGANFYQFTNGLKLLAGIAVMSIKFTLKGSNVSLSLLSDAGTPSEGSTTIASLNNQNTGGAIQTITLPGLPTTGLILQPLTVYTLTATIGQNMEFYKCQVEYSVTNMIQLT